MSEKDEVVKKYFEIFPQYKRLGENLKIALKALLNEKSINFLTIKYRVKQLDDFLEKIKRKSYRKPFEQMEDICGIRIVSYLPSEIRSIKNVIENEFNIVDIINKDNTSLPTQFGYRSQHYILKVKNDWANAPHFRGVADLKFELQLRTVLMDAWAEIEHKLAYKKFQHMPPQFRRKFSLLSAKLEEADEQFEELVTKIRDYKSNLNKNIYESIDTEKSLNLDDLTTLWKQKYPESHKKIKEMRDILDKLQQSGISLREFKKIIEENKIEEKSLLYRAFKGKT